MENFAKFLDKKERLTPDNFCDAYNFYGAFGLYKIEASGIYSALHDKNITSVVEVGRCYSGGLYLYSCLFPNLKKVLSIDIDEYPRSDTAIKEYLGHYQIENDIVVCDSTLYKPDNFIWDFGFIDGGHTGPIVEQDMLIWKDRCRYIGFHDYADKRKNKRKHYYHDVTEKITYYINKYNWKQIGNRGCSEIVLETGIK